MKIRKILKIVFDIAIFIFFISSIVFYSWSYRQGFDYAESWYLGHCICSGVAPRKNITTNPFGIPEVIAPTSEITNSDYVG